MLKSTANPTRSWRFSLSTLLAYVTACCIGLAYFKHYPLQVVFWLAVGIYLWRKSRFKDIGNDVRAIAFSTVALLMLDYLR